MAQRIALWGAVLLLAAIGAISLWQGLPLAPLTESRYYFLTAGLFFIAAAWTALCGRKSAGLGLTWAAATGFAAFLTAIGAYLAIKGAQLIGLGGSPYYLAAGLVLIAIAALLILRSLWSARLYAALLAVTIVWSLVEAGLEFYPLLARLAAFLVVGLWFLAPWTRAHFKVAADRPHRKRGYAGWNVSVTALGVALLVIAGFQAGPVLEGSNFGAPKGNGVTDWKSYGGTTLSTRFVEIDQINTGNVGGLKEIWRYRTEVPYDFKDTPQMVDGSVFVCTAGNTVIALDADTGKVKWRHATSAKVPGGSGPSGLEYASTFARTCRGLGYYDASAPAPAAAPAVPAAPVAAGQVGPQAIAATPPPVSTAAAADCSTRIITGTTNARLIALDAKTGLPCAGFGQGGEVDLLAGLGTAPPGNYMVTSAPLVAGDLVVVGGWVTDNQQIGNPSGVVRAYSARDGHFVWAWDLGNPDNHAMPPEGGQFTRSKNERGPT